MTTFKRDFTFRDNIIEVVARNVRKYKISIVLNVTMEKFFQE